MPFVFKRAQKAVAMFVIIALFFLIAVVVLIGKGSGLFELKDPYITYMNNGHGLSEGQVINYKEVTIGKIQRMQLTDDDNIEVIFYIDKKYSRKLMHKDTVLKIMGGGLLGGGGLELKSYIDTDAAFIEPGSLIFSSDMEAAQDLLTAYELQTTESDLMVKVNEILDMVVSFDPLITGTLINVEESTDSLSRILGGLVGTDYSYASQEILGILWKVNGLLDQLDESTLSTVNSTLSNIEDLTEDDLQQIMLLLQEDLIELKKVMQNLPFGIGTGTAEGTIEIQTGDR